MTRAELHKLVDELPDDAVDTAAEVLERAKHHPEILAELPPWDDEPVTEEEERLVAEARAALARGEGVDWTELKKQLEADDD